jgi:biopolymer transport protein ExbB/TolQ
MSPAAKLDELGWLAWIVLVLLGFVLWWPLGLTLLAFAIVTGRMGAWWRRLCADSQDEIDAMRRKANRQFGKAGEMLEGWRMFKRSSGNRRFDEDRAETLANLEQQERELQEFLQRVRAANDRAEFDQFMAERGNRPSAEPPKA